MKTCGLYIGSLCTSYKIVFRVETSRRLNPALLEKKLLDKNLPSFEIYRPDERFGTSSSSTSKVLEIAFAPFSLRGEHDILALISRFEKEIYQIETRLEQMLEEEQLKRLLDDRP